MDSSPPAVEEGPNLQLWVGPRDVPDDMVDDLLLYLSEQGSCSVNQRESTQQFTEITSKMFDSVATASSALGIGRVLLHEMHVNHTELACVGNNVTMVHNGTAHGSFNGSGP